MNLSNRLETVASMVTKGNIVADIGTDHGYIPIYLVKNGICPTAFAMDINDGPLLRAKEHVLEEGLEEKIKLIKSDGMKELKGQKVDTAVVSGMGGELICKILKESPVLAELKELVLSPHSEVAKVRECVIKNGYSIVEEKMVVDYGKYYNIIRAEKGISEDYTGFDFIFGKKMFETKDAVFYAYLREMRNKYKGIIELLDKNERGVSKRNYELRRMLKDCEAALQKFREQEENSEG